MFHTPLPRNPRVACPVILFFLSINAALFVGPAEAQDSSQAIEWYSRSDTGEARIHLYFFWSETCPHCRKALPFVNSLETRYSWLEVHSLKVSGNVENARRFVAMARQLGEEARGVPAFLFCERMQLGFHSEDTTGASLLSQLQACRMNLLGEGSSGASAPEAPISIPGLGAVDPTSLSLPVLTMVLAGMDAFNPCAFFVLLFLLSLLIHARSRARMAFIGGVFVFISGLIYFVFMAAWLNLFLLTGELKVVTLLAGAVALLIAGINIKDYFLNKRGVTLSIPESAQPGLFDRMRRLVSASSLPSMTVATITLAIVANTYELLCTAGFPMVFTRVLTLHQLSKPTYYLYLVLYNVVYVIPLILIVAVFTFTLGSRKLQEKEGRVLKLLSGMMMLGFGLVLLFQPEALNRVSAPFIILAGAVIATALIVLMSRDRLPGGA